jgi:glutamate-1-semialdehyde 2,1-aminomutase
MAGRPSPARLPRGRARSLPRNGALFICDEVITGFRAGLRGAQGRYGVTADLAIYARRSRRGFRLPWSPAGATSMDTLLDKGVMHGGTYNGNVPEHGSGHRRPR